MAVISLDLARSYAIAAGFSGHGLDVILAIAQAESGLDTLAKNTAGNTPPSLDRGILQINSYWHSEVTDACAFDPECSFHAGYTISKSGTDFTPWSTYGNGAYLRFMPSTAVHWTQPGLRAKVENDGHGDTCGPIVILDYKNAQDPSHFPLTNTFLDAMRSSLIEWGLMNTASFKGMTISSIASAFRNHYGVTPVKVVPYNPNLDWNAFHKDLIDALKNRQHVLIETAKAYALPDNQPGVYFHFVLFGGIDSSLGYWTCNGDTETALHSGHEAVNPSWVGIGPIQACQPVGYIILPAITGAGSGGTVMWKADTADSQQPSAMDDHGTHVHFGMATWLLANDTTADAVQGIPTNWYAYGGKDAYTVLSDATALHYDKDANNTVHITGRDGSCLSETLKALLSQQQANESAGKQIADLQSQIATLQAQLANAGKGAALLAALKEALQ